MPSAVTFRPLKTFSQNFANGWVGKLLIVLLRWLRQGGGVYFLFSASGSL